MESMEQEYAFWQNQRSTPVTVNGKEYLVTIFNASTGGPRPESYREDKSWATVFDTDAEKEDFYIDIKSAAESGWDFSTRWYRHFGKVGGTFVFPCSLHLC
jgi:alpha,alpha-trehalase